MTRKDSEKEAERPHYYSQFWLDIAAGRRVIGGPKPGEEADMVEPEPEPIALPRKGIVRPSGQNDHAEADGRHDTTVHPVPVAPLAEPEEFVEPAPDETDIQPHEADDLDLDVDDGDIPDMDLSLDEEEEDEDEEDLFDDEEEEEEDDDGWSGRGRKKPKPIRPVKPPVKKPKRDPRRF